MCAQVPPHEAAWLRGRWGPEPVHALLAKPGSHSGTPFLKLLEDALRAGGSRGSEPEKDVPSLTCMTLNRACPAEGDLGSPRLSHPMGQCHPGSAVLSLTWEPAVGFHGAPG